MSGELVSTLLAILAVLSLAFLVREITVRRRELSYASLLVTVGLAISLVGVSIDIELTHDLIIMVLLPAVLFQGTTELNLDTLVDNAALILTLALVGLPAAIIVMGVAGNVVFGFPLLVSLVFAAIILPTDPAAVIALFQEFEAPDRLSVTVEGESLLNDGIAVVIFSTLFAAVQESQTSGQSLAELATLGEMAGLTDDLVVVGGGGALVGGLIGYTAHKVARQIQDYKGFILLTVLVAYGSFVVAHHFVGVSGILAVVVAGLLMGGHSEAEYEQDAEKLEFIEHVWGAGAFLASTLLYVLIGAQVNVSDFPEHLSLVVSAAILVVVVRAVVTYPLLALVNRFISKPMPIRCQSLVVWSGLHTVIPIALVLSLPPSFPFHEELRTMVFGVAIISMVVQGLLTPYVLKLTGIARGAVEGDIESGN